MGERILKRQINIIGCGNVGQTLAYLWSQQGTFETGTIVNRSTESATQAVNFIGSGKAVSSVTGMGKADVFMITTPDGVIADSCAALFASGLLHPGSIVFHCSGALSSEVLQSAREKGAVVASVHPVKSFADPEESIKLFSGTFCGVEGDEDALKVLGPAFESIGATTFTLNPEFKTLYHAASVMVCNYLTALLETGVQTYNKSGIERDTAMQVMQPIVQGTVDNIFRLGTVNALTGPIARGDDQVVSRQLEAMYGWNPQYAEIYRDLGRVALQLSRQQGNASELALQTLAELLERHLPALDAAQVNQ